MMWNRGAVGLLTCVALALAGALVLYVGCDISGGGGFPTPPPSGTSTPTPLPTPTPSSSADPTSSPQPTPTPPPGQACSVDFDCDDGLFCNGVEFCVGFVCVAGDDPCDPITEDCDEGFDTCIPGQLGCVSDVDCPGDLVCDAATGECVLGGTACVTSEDCAVFEECDLSTSRCVVSSVCGPGAGPCNIANSSPGCENPECCADVCQFEPLCCVQEWDQECADLAFSVSTCLQP